MKARYIGHPAEDGPRRVRFAGKSFPRDVFIPIDDIPELLRDKLAGNKHFDVSDDDLSEADAAALERADNAHAPRRAAQAASDGEDGDDGDEAPEAGDKESILDALDRLADKHPGKVSFDRRWGAKRLAETLEAARFEVGDEE